MRATLPNTASPKPEHILRRLDWQVVRRLDGLLQGDYRTLFYGTGLDFSDLREYQPQDDVRHIDWNVTARTNHLYVRQYMEDREVTAWFLLDLSSSMRFGPEERSKQRVLIDLVATLARLLTRSGNKVGAILYNSALEGTVPPLGGRKQVLRLMRDVLRVRKSATLAPTDLKILLNAALGSVKRRSLLFLISDFISEPGWEAQLSALNRRHELIAIRLWDAREAEMPSAGLLVMEDAETGEQLYVDTSDPTFRRNFLDAAERRETSLRKALSRAGVDLFAISTEEDLVGAILRLAAQRKARSR